MLLIHLERRRAYADALITKAQGARENLELEVYPSLSLRILERFEDPYYYEEVCENGHWLVKVPVVVHNHGETPVDDPIIITASSSDGIKVNPMESQLSALSPRTAKVQDFGVRALSMGNVKFCIEGTDCSKSLTLAHCERGDSNSTGTLLGEAQDTVNIVVRQLQEAFKDSSTSPEQRAVFLRVFPGAGRTELLRHISERLKDDNTVVISLNISDFFHNETGAAMPWQRFWHTLLTQVQKTQPDSSRRPVIDAPEQLALERVRNVMSVMLGEGESKRKLVVILDNPDGLSNSDKSWLALESITNILDGTVVVIYDRVKQPWEQRFWQNTVCNSKEISLLDENNTHFLVQRVLASGKSLTELGHKGVWVYSGGHPGFIKALCGKLPFTDTERTLGLDAVKQAMREMKDDPDVQKWYSHFSRDERCVLDTLARGGFVQEGTGLLKGLRKPQNGSDSWIGIEKLQAYLRR